MDERPARPRPPSPRVRAPRGVVGIGGHPGFGRVRERRRVAQVADEDELVLREVGGGGAAGWRGGVDDAGVQLHVAGLVDVEVALDAQEGPLAVGALGPPGHGRAVLAQPGAGVVAATRKRRAADPRVGVQAVRAVLRGGTAGAPGALVGAGVLVGVPVAGAGRLAASQERGDGDVKQRREGRRGHTWLS